MSEQTRPWSIGFSDAWNAREPDAFDEIVAPDAVDHGPQNPFRDTRGPGTVEAVAPGLWGLDWLGVRRLRCER